MNEFDLFVENHLNLQVKISYHDHHDFLLRHGLGECSRVLDVGTGNGSFVARLAQDHDGIQFIGIDKRRHCIESCGKLVSSNLQFEQVDMFSRTTQFDFSQFDGFLMRYFLLHVDNSQKILELFKSRAQSGAKFWIIDLDWSQFNCEPSHPVFDKMTKLVKDFCSKVSVESLGVQKLLPMLEKLRFQEIKVECIPFSTERISREELAEYLKGEVICYSKMNSEVGAQSETGEIIQFIDDHFLAGKSEISYAMKLITARL